jgi:hypothetical protein
MPLHGGPSYSTPVVTETLRLARPELPATHRLVGLHDEEVAVRAVAEDTFEELISVEGDH